MKPSVREVSNRMSSSSQQNADSQGTSSAVPDVEALMARIRDEVRQELERSGTTLPRYMPPPPKLADGTVAPILYSDELNFLNAHWNQWAEPVAYSSHRKFVGRVVIGIKNRLRSFLVETLLKSYFEREREFQMNLVRYLNSTARYVDARNAEIFWQLVSKIDNDVAAINDRTDRLFDEALQVINARSK